jgi:hypothetical protein
MSRVSPPAPSRRSDRSIDVEFYTDLARQLRQEVMAACLRATVRNIRRAASAIASGSASLSCRNAIDIRQVRYMQRAHEASRKPQAQRRLP